MWAGPPEPPTYLHHVPLNRGQLSLTAPLSPHIWAVRAGPSGSWMARKRELYEVSSPGQGTMGTWPLGPALEPVTLVLGASLGSNWTFLSRPWLLLCSGLRWASPCPGVGDSYLFQTRRRCED